MAGPPEQSKPPDRESAFAGALTKARKQNQRGNTPPPGNTPDERVGIEGKLRSQVRKTAQEESPLSLDEQFEAAGVRNAARRVPFMRKRLERAGGLISAPGTEDARIASERKRQREVRDLEKERGEIARKRRAGRAAGGRLSGLRDRRLRRKQKRLTKKIKKKKKFGQLIGAFIIRLSWAMLWVTWGHSIYIIDLMFFIGFAVPFLGRMIVPEVGMEWFVGMNFKNKAPISKATVQVIKVAEFTAMFVITFLVASVDLLFLTFILTAAYIVLVVKDALSNLFGSIIDFFS